MTAKRPPGPDLGRVLASFRGAFGDFGRLGTLPFTILGLGVGTYSLYKSVYFVQGGCKAVKFNVFSGLSAKTYGEGANFAIPWVETPIVFDMRNKATELVTASGSRDLQMISMSVRVLYKPNEKALPEIYRHLGVGYADVVLPSVINEVVKAVIAQFNASELLVKRSEVSARVASLLRHRSALFNIDITDVSITQMSFGAEYTAAVEKKQIAQQNAEKAKFVVEQALQEKRSAIVLAQGEAESARLISQALQQSPGFVELRRIEAAKHIARAVASGRGQYYLDSATLMLAPDAAAPSGAPEATSGGSTGKKKGGVW
jgi:prohibitin 2